jgi:hypothetical protein
MSIFASTQSFVRLQAVIRQLGAINACLYLLNRLTSMLGSGLSFNKYYFAAQFINGQPLLPAGKGNQFRVAEVSSQILEIQLPSRPPHVIADRFEQGAVCLAAYKEDDFAGCLWYCKKQYKEDEVRCVFRFGSEAVWDFDVYVEPKYRLSPAFMKLWDETSRRLVDEGCCWSLSRISAFNPMSLSSHKRMGAKIIGWALFVEIGNIQITIASLKPFLHLSFKQSSFPVFDFQLPTL